MLKDYELDYISKTGLEDLDFDIFRHNGRISLVSKLEREFSGLVEPDYEHGSWKKWILEWPKISEERNFVVARNSQVMDMYAREIGLENVNYVSIERAHEKLRGVRGRNGEIVIVHIEDIDPNDLTSTEFRWFKEATRMARNMFCTDRILSVMKFRLP